MIQIEDTKIPSSCELCFAEYKHNCMIAHKYISDSDFKSRPKDCPLSEVRDKKSVIKEIKRLAEFHSVEVPIVYGDGTEATDKMLPLDELSKILFCVLEGEEE